MTLIQLILMISCFRFIPRTTEGAYIYLMKGSGCSSSIGRTGSRQTVSLGLGCVYSGRLDKYFCLMIAKYFLKLSTIIHPRPWVNIINSTCENWQFSWKFAKPCNFLANNTHSHTCIILQWVSTEIQHPFDNIQQSD